MRTTLTAAISAAALSFGAGGPALAQEDPTQPPQARPTSLGIDSPIRDLLANPAAVAVLDKDLPGMTSDPRLDMVKSMSLRQIAKFPEADLDEVKLRLIETDLKRAVAKPTAEAATPVVATGASRTLGGRIGAAEPPTPQDVASGSAASPDGTPTTAQPTPK